MWIKEIQIQNVIQYITDILYKQSYFICFFRDNYKKDWFVLKTEHRISNRCTKPYHLHVNAASLGLKYYAGTSLSICIVIFMYMICSLSFKS